MHGGSPLLPAAPLHARLDIPPPAETVEGDGEPLLKDTLADDAPEIPRDAPPPQAPSAAPSLPRPPTQAAARRKLLDHLFYPQEAIERNIEGEVRLLIAFDAGGRVVSVEVAASSGHPALDRAAVAAARAMGRLPGVGSGEMILPVVFRLE